MEENTNTKDGLKVYEVGFHLLPTLDDQQVLQNTELIKAKITEVGGEIISEDQPVLTNLAYEIVRAEEHKKTRFSKAFFGWVKFEVGTEVVEAIDSFMKKNKSVLRFIIVKTARENTIYTEKPLVAEAITQSESIVGHEAPRETAGEAVIG